MSTKNTYLSLLITSMLLICGALTATAQTTQGGEPLAGEILVNRQGEQLVVNMEIDATQLDLGRNEMVTLTPLILSNSDQELRAALQPVILGGSIRNKVLHRQMALQSRDNVGTLNPFAVIERENNTPQVIRYHTTLPYEPWMEDASLVLHNGRSACAGCDLGNEAMTLLAQIFPEAYVPVWSITYLEPEPEEVKARSEQHSASFNYPLDQYALLRQYKNNEPEFDRVDKVIREVQANKDLTITEFVIEGFASPEGGFEYNRLLSERRANSFAEYLRTKHQVERSSIKSVKGIGEDWNGLRQAVEKSNLADKQAIIRIIDQVTPPDARDAELRKLSGGNSYRTLANNFYPPLRRTDYKIAYNVRAFSVEEAKEQIKSNPRLLSLNEMYLVAREYPTESPEFKEAFDIAARLYPTDPIAQINTAASDLEGGNTGAALERLEKVKDDPRAWNNLGVAYAKAGDLTTAAEYLKKAANNSDPIAVANMEELKKATNNP